MLDEADMVKGRFYKYIYKNKPIAAKKLLTRIRNCAGNDDVIESTRTYLINNWDAIQRAFHDKHVLGCSAEGHISSIYSERMSSRPMGWSETGSDRMCRLRCYVKNAGREKIIDLVEYRREQELKRYRATGTEGMIDVETKKKYVTADKRKAMGYIERIQGSIPGMTARKRFSIRNRM